MVKSLELNEKEVSTLQFILHEYKLQHSVGAGSLGLTDVSEFKALDTANHNLPTIMAKLNSN